jgi:hypothetical protein
VKIAAAAVLSCCRHSQQARKLFRSECGRIEQAYAQQRPPTPIAVRRMEFEAVRKIVVVFGIAVEDPP